MPSCRIERAISSNRWCRRRSARGALAAVIVVFVWLWVRSLGRALVTADTTTQSSRVRGTRLPLAWLGLRGTVAARFWLYQRREPLSLVYWALVAVITAAPSASSVFGHKHHPAVILASAVFGTAFVGIFHANSAGLTGPAFVLEATALGSSRDLRAYFSGQNLVLCVIGAPLVVAVCFALAAVVGDPGMGVEATPEIVGAVLAANGPDAIRIGVMLPCAAAYGFALAVIGVRLAAKVAESTLPEMCQVALRTAT